MQNSPFRFGPIALSNTYTTNLLNPATATGGVNAGSASQYVILKHLRILNKTATSPTFRLYIGATGANAAGTEFWGYDTVVAANSYVDYYGYIKLAASDFLVGGASAATTLTIQGEGEIGVVITA